MFYHTITEDFIAEQIAYLLNQYSNLGTRKTKNSILRSLVKYTIETHGRLVVGAVGLDRQSYTFTEVKHLVVRPKYQRRGIGRYLVKQAIKTARTKMLYATVREGNKASISLFKQLGFASAGRYSTGGYQVILLVRATPPWEKEKPSLASVSSVGMNSSPSSLSAELRLSWEGLDIEPQCSEQLGIPAENSSTYSTSRLDIG